MPIQPHPRSSAQAPNGPTLRMLRACADAHPQELAAALDEGADPAGVDSRGSSAWHHLAGCNPAGMMGLAGAAALPERARACAEILARANAPADLLDEFGGLGFTPLGQAAHFGRMDMLSLLVEFGHRPTDALAHLLSRGHKRDVLIALPLLLAAGADPLTPSPAGEDVVQLARKAFGDPHSVNHCPELVEMASAAFETAKLRAELGAELPHPARGSTSRI